MSVVEARSKTIVLIAAVAENGVIGTAGSIPWHLPEDFAHFRRATLNQIVLMGRATFDSIGRPLPGRRNIVLTRSRHWRRDGVHVVHDLQAAIDLAEELPGNLMVMGGSHLYAATMPIAHMQVISEIHQKPDGDAFYPVWDRTEWVLARSEKFAGFDVKEWHRGPRERQLQRFMLPPASAELWWNSDWAARLQRAVAAQRRDTATDVRVNWDGVHQAAMQIIVEAAEDHLRRRDHSLDSENARHVRLNRHLSLQDLNAIQGALLHWSDFIAPRPM